MRSPKELRITEAKQARSDAMNRFIAECQSQTKAARQEMYVYTGTAIFFGLIFLSALLGFK